MENEEQTRREQAVSGIGLLLLWCIAWGVTFLLASGCTAAYKGARVTEGADLACGISIPAADGAADLTFLNYLSGFRLGVAENASLKVEYQTAETNSYFGVIETRSAKSIKAKVDPCETAGQPDK